MKQIELNRLLDELKKKHAEEIEVLLRLQRFVEPEPAPRKGGTGSGRGVRTGLTEQVLRLFENYNHPEYPWTRAEIEQELGDRIVAKDKVSAVNQALRNLIRRGKIRVVRQGSGSVLSTYAKTDGTE